MIEHSILSKDIATITAFNNPYIFDMRLKIHSVIGNLDIDHIETMDIISDYESSITDRIIIKIKMGLGTYTRYLLNYKERIEASFIFEYNRKVRYVHKYKVTIPRDSGINTSDEFLGTSTNEVIDVEHLHVVVLEMTQIESVPLKLLRVPGGSYTSTGVDLLRSLLSEGMSRVKVAGKPPYNMLNIQRPNVENKADTLSIPDQELLTAMPEYINNKLGIYSAGIGMYMHNVRIDESERVTISIYSLYNPYLYRDASKRLRIVSEDSIGISLAENTYMVQEKTISIIAVPKVESSSKAASSDYDVYGFMGLEGKGSRDLNVQAKDKSVSYKQANRSAVISKKRLDGEDIISHTGLNRDISAIEASSMIAAGMGENRHYLWSNADPALLIPGMPVSVLMVERKHPGMRYGTLIYAHTTYIYDYNLEKYTASVLLTVRVPKEDEIEDI